MNIKINKPLIKLFSIIMISCLGIIVYANTFNCSFHFDDNNFIVDNPAIKNIRDFLNNWEVYPCRFIIFLSIVVNYHFNNLNVFGYHVFNLGIHLVTAILVWWLTLLTFFTPAMKGNKITQHANLIALFAGLVFVSHPMQTEAVTYIWQRATSIAALFYLASLCLYIKSRLLCHSQPEGRRILRHLYYFGSLILAIMAMFTKENTITLPLMIVLYEFCFFNTTIRLNWKRFVPFLLTIFIIPLTMLLQKSVSIQVVPITFVGSYPPSPLNYLLTQFTVIVTYIRLGFLPLAQNIDYDHPVFKSIFELPVLAGFLFLAGIIYWAKYLFKEYRLISFSIFWFFLTLLPDSSLFPLRDVIIEHRLYLPLVGYSLFLVSGLYYGLLYFIEGRL